MGLTNNDIFKKLRVAHKLRDEEIVEICKLVDFEVSKSEIGAIFRNENHKNYMNFVSRGIFVENIQNVIND